MVRLSSAVWAINGVCVFDSTVPFDLRKFSRCGICSRSDGTFGLSRAKWTLSKTRLMTCWTPLPSWQPATGAAGVAPALGAVATAALTPATRAAPAVRPAIRRVWDERDRSMRNPQRGDNPDAAHANPPKWPRPDLRSDSWRTPRERLAVRRDPARPRSRSGESGRDVEAGEQALVQ